MSEPTLVDAIAMVAELHQHRAINAAHAVEILAAVANIQLYEAASIIREYERQEHGEPADQWTDAVDTYYENRLRDLHAEPPADDWRRPERGPDGSWG